MKEIIVYSIAGIATLAILGYSIHMFVGGLVSPGLERALIICGIIIGAIVIALMVRDVLRSRRNNIANGDGDQP